MNDELLDELRGANPFADTGDTPKPGLNGTALFEQITANNGGTIKPTAGASWSRPAILLPSALAAAGLLVIAVFAFTAARATPAMAAVTEAATATAGFESGRADTVIELREGPGPTATIRVAARFQGRNYHATTTRAEPIDGQPELDSITISAEGATHHSFGDLLEEGRFWVADDVIPGAFPGLIGDPSLIVPERVIELLTNASDFGVLNESVEASTYGASIATSQLQRIGIEALPPGLAAFAEPGTTDLPEILEVSVVVADGQLQQLVVDVNGETPDGFVDATVTTTYSQLGEAQQVDAPNADLLIDYFSRPQVVCDPFNIAPDLIPDQPGVLLTDEVAEELNTRTIDCLEEQGEQEVADAMRVSARASGLCQPEQVGADLLPDGVNSPITEEIALELDVLVTDCLEELGEHELVDASALIRNFWEQ